MKRWWLRLGSYAASQRRGLAALLLLLLLGVALEALLPWPLKLVVDHALTGQPLPAAVDWIARLPGAGGTEGLLAWLALALVLLFVASQGVQLAKSLVQADVAGRMQYGLAADLFDHLQALSLVYHGRARKGDLLRRVAVDTACVPGLVTGVLLSLVTSLVTLVVLFTIMWRLDPVLAAVAAGVALPMGMLMRLLGPRMTERAYEQQQCEGAVWTVAEQTLTALPLVQAFGREEYEGLRFKGASGRTIRAYLRALASQLQFKIGVDGSVALGTAAVLLIGGWHVLGGTSSIGTLVVFLSYLTALYAPLVLLAYLSSTYAGAAGSARRVIEVLDADEMVRDAPGATPLPEASRGHVQLQEVVFGYEPGRPVLKRVSLEIRPGERVALAGSTGAGKTTLVSLILRLFDPWEGRVLLDGGDVRAATLSSVRERVALVLQDPFLLPLSIADNIAYGRPGASREAIVAAAFAANADEFVRRLPNGYDEVIGERGATLSGGQKQRIAIARALLRDAPLLILDEPTAALDAKTEVLVMDAIERLMEGRTTISIAHRLSTVRRADRIILLEKGRIVETGTHDELLSLSRAYRRLQMAGLKR
jgi:ATP-binding cassette subfamily B protein/subfamily B ATP-binding cassette protein MsbA